MAPARRSPPAAASRCARRPRRPGSGPSRAGSPAGPAAAAAEEKTEFDVELTSFEADKKLKVIKEIKDITGLGLGEAKALVEGAPKIIKEGASKEEAEALKAKLSEVGATITIK